MIRRGPNRKDPEDKATIMVRISPRTDKILAELEKKYPEMFRSDILQMALKAFLTGETDDYMAIQDELIEEGE